MSALMTGKRGLIAGIANDHSIAWGIARALAHEGAELALSYQNETLGRRVKPLAKSLGCHMVLRCDVSEPASLDHCFTTLAQQWGTLDFVVHALAFSKREELRGPYINTSRENFLHTMDISCFSFTQMAARAAPLMPHGGALVTLSYMGAQRPMPNYNVMGLAKAALETSVRYLAVDLGPQQIRVNAISCSPMRTVSGAAIAEARAVFKWAQRHAPLNANASLEDVGSAALYLLSDLSKRVTGEILYVDGGYHIIGMPRHENKL